MMGKSSKCVTDLAYPPGRTKIPRDKNIGNDILTISKFSLYSAIIDLSTAKTCEIKVSKTLLCKVNL